MPQSIAIFYDASMPRYSLRTLILVMLLGGPLLAVLYLHPMALIYGLIAAPTIAAVLVTVVMTPVLGALALLQFARRFWMK